MRPATGQIHRLPVKVLYSLDSSTESYVTVLTEWQEVYVHPAVLIEPNTQLVGSAYIKPIAWGVCYASPECLPHDNSLDYTVYTMDPMQQSQRISRAFPPSGASSSSSSIGPSHAAETSSSWTGKGYLSWALNEDDQGSTLVRGRLTRDHDFASSSMSEAGGLEGLVAAAAAREGHATQKGAGKNRRNGAEEADGKAWGLEVVLSLKMVSGGPGQEYLGRKEFVDSIARKAQPSQTNHIEPAKPLAVPRQQRPQQAKAHPQQVNGAARTSQPLKKSDISAATASILSQLSNGTQAKPPETSTLRPSTATVITRQVGTKSAANGPRTAVPEGYESSAIPMMTSLSLQGMPRPMAATPMPRQSSLPPAPSAQGPRKATVTVPDRTAPPTSPEIPPADSATSQTPRNRAEEPTSQPPLDRAREVTPPPAPAPRSPPPSTPRRANLYALLRSDSKMSPGLARQLTNNPELLKLLKAMPASPRGAPVGRGDPPSPSKPPPPPPTAHPTALAKAAPAPPKASPAFSDLQSPAAGTETGIGLKADVVAEQGCSNCGTLSSRSWLGRTNNAGQFCRVCYDCGVYWNQHKRFRPAELWSDDTEQQPAAKRPARDSPAAKLLPPQAPAPPCRSSPRKHNRAQTGSILSSSAARLPAPPAAGSPRKRKGKAAAAPPPESPRRATRAAAREAETVTVPEPPSQPTADTDNNPFMPSVPATTSTQAAHGAAQTATYDTPMPMSDAEIDALLASFLAVEGGDTAQDTSGQIALPGGGPAAAAAPGCAPGLEGNLTLDQIFSGAFDENGQVSQEIISLLNSGEM